LPQSSNARTSSNSQSDFFRLFLELDLLHRQSFVENFIDSIIDIYSHQNLHFKILEGYSFQVDKSKVISYMMFWYQLLPFIIEKTLFTPVSFFDLAFLSLEKTFLIVEN
jgi:hypothetical protein